jgi:hypothetical protein
MRSRRPTRLAMSSARLGLAFFAALLTSAAALVTPAGALAGPYPQEFDIYSCAAAPGGDSQAWELTEEPADKMVIGRDCLPGRGAGGIITRSAAQSGYAPAGTRAHAVMAVPEGMEIRRLVWAGEMWRRDCDWTAELYAVTPTAPDRTSTPSPAATARTRGSGGRPSSSFRPSPSALATRTSAGTIRRRSSNGSAASLVAARRARSERPRADASPASTRAPSRPPPPSRTWRHPSSRS